MKPLRILLVDDHLEMGQVLADILKLESEFTVVGTAHNDLEAIALIPKVRPDMILMDFSNSSVDAIKTIRRISRYYPTVAIVMMSFSDDPALIRAARKAGAMGYITKPIATVEEFYATLHKAHWRNQIRRARGSERTKKADPLPLAVT